MELAQLIYFQTAAKHGHITKAAEALHVAQPALTQSVKRLEKELGVSLFTRKGRGVVLNACGTYLMQKLAPILDSLERLPSEVADFARQEHDTVRVNILAASSLVTKAIIAYKRAAQNVKFNLVQSVEDSNCDIIVTSGDVHEQWLYNRIEYHIFEEEIFLAVPKDSTYAAKGSVCLSEMENAAFISLGGYKKFRNSCDMFCAAAGFLPQIVFESDSIMAVQDLIGAGQGVGFWPAYSWGNVNADIVTPLPILEPVCKRNLIIQLHNHRADATAPKAFYDFLLQYMADMILL